MNSYAFLLGPGKVARYKKTRVKNLVTLSLEITKGLENSETRLKIFEVSPPFGDFFPWDNDDNRGARVSGSPCYPANMPD
jgi:hypothetical protein